MGFFELKGSILKMKNITKWLKSHLETDNKWVSQPKDRSIEDFCSENKREKKLEENSQTLSDLCKNKKWSHTGN